jgi:L-aspartate oxidase
VERFPPLVHGGFVVVGAGLAGLSAALAAAPAKVLVLSPTPLGEGASSAWAQGGLAAALGPDDNPALHAADTVAAGAGLSDPNAVRVLTEAGPDAVRALAALGAPFDRASDGSFSQSLEAAHGRARVARVKGDQAGGAIMAAVIAAVRVAAHIEVREGVRLTGLLQDHEGRVRGVTTDQGEIVARAVILATGGIGGLFAVTTTPATLQGEGLAAAALAGATIADPEFVQFHPTAIDIGRDPAPLATEALRGEGATLVDAEGRSFVDALAPRDVVARAIHKTISKGGKAFLDARQAIGEAFPHEFPAVFAACMSAGIDPRRDLIPVAPACHYHMGGIAADLDGHTSLPGLFAAGECASAGVHGANRLASNSLLEAAVAGARAGTAARDAADPGTEPLPACAAPALPPTALQQLRRAISRDAGVVRDAAGLTRLLNEIDALRAAHGDALPLVTARLTAQAALDRPDSVGAHFRADGRQAVQPQRTFITWAQAARTARVAAE